MAVMIVALIVTLPLYAGGAMVVRHEPGGAVLLWSGATLVIVLAWLSLHISG